MAVDHIQDHSYPFLMGGVDQPLHISSFAKPLIHPEVADGQKSPVCGVGYIGDRHDLYAVDSQVLQVFQMAGGSPHVPAELIDHQLIDYEILLPGSLP